MKWYFAISESSLDRDDHNWRGLIEVAVKSALANTSLSPHMIYDGEDNEFTSLIKKIGVKIIKHRVSFYDRIKETSKNDFYIKIASGAFLRLEIPIIEKEDEFVLYTDCDVLFLKDPIINNIKPKYFSASSQSTIKQYEDMNSGVMVINVQSMRDDLHNFIDFISKNITEGLLDQEMLRLFYGDRYDFMDEILNWKPYWGFNPDAQIVHWHGPKPIIAKRMMSDQSHVHPVDVWQSLLDRDRLAYSYYTGVWDTIAIQSWGARFMLRGSDS